MDSWIFNVVHIEMLNDFKDSANAQHVYNRNKNNDPGLRTPDSHNQSEVSRMHAHDYRSVITAQLHSSKCWLQTTYNSRYATKSADSQGPNPDPEFTSTSGIWQMKVFWLGLQSIVDVLKLENLYHCWKLRVLLFFTEISEIVLVPGVGRSKMTLNSLLLSTQKFSLHKCLTPNCQ